MTPTLIGRFNQQTNACKSAVKRSLLTPPHPSSHPRLLICPFADQGLILGSLLRQTGICAFNPAMVAAVAVMATAGPVLALVVGVVLCLGLRRRQRRRHSADRMREIMSGDQAAQPSPPFSFESMQLQLQVCRCRCRRRVVELKQACGWLIFGKFPCGQM